MRKLGIIMLPLIVTTVWFLAGCGGDTKNDTTNTYYATTGTVSTNANLSYLEVSEGTLNPHFSPDVTSYTVIGIGTATMTVTPIASVYGAATLVNDQVVPPATASGSIPLNAGQNTIEIRVIAPDGVTTRTYTITAIRITQEAYIKSSNTGTSDRFGYSIALAGDTLAVGAPQESSRATGVNGNQSDNSFQNSGAVYMFRRSGTTWTQQAYLKSSNTGTNDNFGRAIALSGDTLVVGAYGESSNATVINGNELDDSAPNSGAVYVFTSASGSWTQQAYIKASNAGAGDYFGWSVALDGDTLVVGARFEDSNAKGVNGDQLNNGASGSGAAYVFTRSGGVWSQQAYLKASNTDSGDEFGFNVAVAGDTVAVAATNEFGGAKGVNGNQLDNSVTGSGAVYVFTRTGGSWSQQAYLKASNTGAFDYYGWSVAISGDTLAVGSVAEGSSATGVNGDQSDNSLAQAGAVYVYTRSGAIWSQQAYLKASNTGTTDQFGWSVSLSGDVLAVGAYRESSIATGINGNQADNSAYEAGAAYVFSRTGNTWSQQSYIKASNAGAGDYFGQSVALSNDTLAVGAFGEASGAAGVNGNQADNGSPGSGAVYLFR